MKKSVFSNFAALFKRQHTVYAPRDKNKHTTYSHLMICIAVWTYCTRPDCADFALCRQCFRCGLQCGSGGGVQGECNSPLQLSKYQNLQLSRNTRKTISDVGKTMSYVEKIISDIIQTTSDLFSPFASL